MCRILGLTILVVFAIFAPALAQTERRPVSTKFDEYGAVGGCDHGARLDNFAIQLQNQPGSTAYIFAYAPEEIGKGFLEIAKAYLVMSRGIAPDRIKTVYGGRNDVLSEPRIQLWLAPPGAERPKPQKFKPNLETFRGLFGENRGWDNDVREAVSADGEDDKRFPVFEDESTGPAISNVTHPSLAEVLKQQKTAVAYIVAYNGEESSPGAWQRMAQQDVQRLKDLGIEANRLKIVYGGNKKEPTVQLWVTPADAPVPVADAGPEQPPSKAVSLAWLSDSDLGYSGVERAALKRMADALRQFPTLRACVVVTFGTYKEPPEEATQQSIVEEETPDADKSTAPVPAAEPEPEPADVAKLVEQWKDELAAKYKIGADRFVVLFAHSDGFSNNMLETWVVPPGAALPQTEEEPAPVAVPSQQTTKELSQSVTLTLTVTDNFGRYVSNLRKDQLTVLDQDVPLDTISLKEADLPLSVGFLFDATLLNLKDVFKASNDALLKFVADSHPQNEYFVMGFDSQTKLGINFTNDQNQIAKGFAELGKLKPSNKKALYDAIQSSIKTVGAGRYTKRVIVLISDDKDDASVLKHEELIDILKKSDVLLYPIRLKAGKYEPSSSVLNEFSAVTGSKGFYPKNPVEFAEVLEVIALELRHQYSLEYKPVTSPTVVWRRLEFRVKPLKLKNSTEVPLFPRSRAGYYSRS